MASHSFTSAVVRGTYAVAVTGHGGESPFASVGLLNFDGQGRVSGSFTENRPADGYGNRQVIFVPYLATYSVDANGIGATAVPNDAERDSIFSVRKADLIDGVYVAQEIAVVFSRLESSSGNLKIATASRLPDDIAFTDASLKGRYVGASISQGGQAVAAGFGVLRYDGNGGFSESNIANVQGSSFRDRQVVSGSDTGKYAVNPDGTGTIAGGGVVFVVTRASVVGGVPVAEEYAFFVKDLVPTTGTLFTGITRKLSD
jgi:hypothetical protein